MKAVMGLVDRALSSLESFLIIVFTTAALALGVTQVVLRYVFNTGLPWAETIFVLLTVAGMMFAGSRAVRDDKHVGVDLVPNLLPPRPRRFASLASLAVSLALCAYFAYCGARYAGFLHMIDSVSPATGIPDWIIYMLVPITLGAFSLRYVMRIVQVLRGEPAPHHHGIGTPPSPTEIEGRS